MGSTATPFSIKARTWTHALRVWCAFMLLMGVLAPAFLTVSNADAAPATTKPELAVSLRDVPVATKSGKDLTFEIAYTLPSDTYWTSLDIRLKNENQKGIDYVGGWVGNQTKGTQTYKAKFALSGSNLSSQVYTIDVAMRSKAVDGTVFEGSAQAFEPIYRDKEAKAKVALCVRLETNISTNANGEFVVDPAKNTHQIDEVQRILNELDEKSNAHVTFAIAPVMLEEWDTIAQGYTLAAADKDGEPEEIPADDATAKRYDRTLSSLRSAVQRGAASLAPVSYSDPDLPSLIDSDLGEDISTQYARGIAVTNSTVTTSTETGTIPFGLTLPTDAVEPLVENKLSWTVLSDSFAKTNDEQTAASGVCSIEDNDAITALVNDSKASDAIAKNDTTTLLKRVMSRYGDDKKEQGPLIAVASVTTSGTPTAALNALKALDEQPWVFLASADSVADTTKPRETVTVTQPGPLSSPADYWDTVFAAREDARATEAIVDATSETPLRATKNSLIAESSAWSQPNGEWKGEERGRAFAEDAIKTAGTVLNAVKLQIESVTLAKNEGEVPLVLSNSGDESLNVIIEVSGTSGLEVDGPHTIEARLEKNDNYFTIPVQLETNSPSGDLHVNIMAGEKAIDSQTVTVKSSMMNRIFMLTAIALVLIGILIYIRHHVKRANEPKEQTNEDTFDLDTPPVENEPQTAEPKTEEDL